MHTKFFLNQLDDASIAAAIARAEQLSSGEIRVCVSHRHRLDALGSAERRFFQLHMERTPQRNAVLIYFAPLAQTFALWGDIGIHDKCGVEFWQSLAMKIAPRLEGGSFNMAVHEAIQEVARMLEQHFPRNASDHHHLPNTVVHD